MDEHDREVVPSAELQRPPGVHLSALHYSDRLLVALLEGQADDGHQQRIFVRQGDGGHLQL